MSLSIAHKRIQPSLTDTVTNTSTATAHAKTISVPAYTLRAGDKFEGVARVTNTTTNGSNTFLHQVYLGPSSAPATGILLAESTALDGTDGDVCTLKFDFEVTTIGAGSTPAFTGGGIAYYNAGTTPSKSRSYARATDAQVSTFSDLVIAVVTTQSAASTSNISRLDQLDVVVHPSNPSE